MALEKRELTPAEVKRQERLEKTLRNKRGRQNPASVPARLTRTAAFAPRNNNLVTDSNFRQRYVVPNQSIIEVSGRELGFQHRDAIYALFRLQRSRIRVRNPEVPENVTIAGKQSAFEYYEVNSTWRTLLQILGIGIHVNNLMTLISTFEDIQKVVITVYEGDPEKILPLLESRRVSSAFGAGSMENIIREIAWDGLKLDSNIRVQFGTWVFQAIEKSRLVSLNADVQFRLRSGYAKSFWPYIDSMTRHTYIDEETLAHLVGRDLKSPAETKNTRGQFRRDCKGAFEDMISAGGLKAWHAQDLGTARIKRRRYYYTHSLPRQAELPLSLTDTLSATPKVDHLSAQSDLFSAA